MLEDSCGHTGCRADDGGGGRARHGDVLVGGQQNHLGSKVVGGCKNASINCFCLSKLIVFVVVQ